MSTTVNLTSLNKTELENPIYYSVQKNDRVLLEQAIALGFLDKFDHSAAFDLAIQKNEYDLAALILQKKLHLEATGTIASASDVKTVEKIVQNIQSKSSLGEKSSPASRAAALGDLPALKKIELSQLKEADANGLTPLHFAILHQKQEAVHFIREHSDLSYLTSDSRSYLHFAAATGNKEIVQELSTCPDTPDRQGWTAAHFLAVSARHPSDFLILAKNGADVTRPNPKGLTPLACFFAKFLTKTESLLSAYDVLLALMNIAMISTAYSCYSYFLPGQPPKNQPLEFYQSVAGLMTSLFIRQNVVCYLPSAQTMPRLVQWSIRPIGCFVNSLVTGGPILSLISTTAVVAKSALNGLWQSIVQFRNRPLRSLGASCVHLTNLISEGAVLFSFFGGLPLDPKQWFNSAQNCPVPEHLPSPADLVKRAADPRLQPDKCLNHAKMILAGPDSFNEAAFSKQGCSYVNNLYHQLSKLFHPDRCTGKRCQDAFVHLVAAKESLCPRPAPE